MEDQENIEQGGEKWISQSWKPRLEKREKWGKKEKKKWVMKATSNLTQPNMLPHMEEDS